MTERRPDEYYMKLEGRLRSLIPLAREVLTAEAVKWYTEYLDAGEYGLAIEVAAEGFRSDTAASRSKELALALLAEADLMGMRGPAVDRLHGCANPNE